MSTPHISHRSSAGSGLGISYASLSPPSVSTTQVSTGFIGTPPTSPERATSPARQFSNESPSRLQPKKVVSLRPTHHRSESGQNFASFSALPPTGRSSPLASDRRDGSTHDRHNGPSDAGLRRNTSNASASTVGSRIKKSRSSEILRRLSGRQETVSGGKYVPLSGDDGEREEDIPERDERSDNRHSRTRSETISTISAHPAQSPQTHIPSPIDGSHHFMPTSFPTARPTSDHRSQSPHHAISSSSHLPPLSPAFARSQPQSQTSFYRDNNPETKRISDPSTGIHSQNHALFVAEKGGKVLAYSAEGIWSANSIASTPPVGPGSIAHPPLNQHYGSEEEHKIRPWSYSDEAHYRPLHVRSLSEGANLARYGTLLHPASGSQRASTELGIMLGNKSRRLSQGKLLPAPDLDAWKAMGGEGGEKVKLEAAKKRRARVEVDVVLERECVVEGGEVRGRMEIRVNGSKSEGLRVGGGKVRVVGYEDISPQSRHIFYHHPFPLPLFANPPIPNGSRSSLFGSHSDSDGFYEAVPGNHFVPFCMRLPLAGGAKGSYTSPHPKGPSVRYVVVGSVKLLHPKTGKRSIAHFYRPIVILPYLNPGTALAPCEEMVEVIERRGLGWSLGGAKGVVELRIALGRDVWVSGQRVWCEVGVRNDSSKRIKSLTLALLQTVQTFLPDNDKRAVSTDKDGFPNADEALGIASTVRRKLAEESIVADEPDHRAGRVTGKSWWTGVEAGDMGGWDLSLLLPNGLLTIPRSQLVEVTYTLRLTANSNSNLFVDVPITLINFLSIDPPPMPGDGIRYGSSIRNSVISNQQYTTQRPVASTAGHGGYGDSQGSLHSGESGLGGAARASSTTLHIDALLSAGRARAEAEAASHYPEYARARQQRPISTISEYGNGDIFGQPPHPLGGWSGVSPLPGVPPPTRPKTGRGLSYLSARSGNLLSETEEEDEDDDEKMDRQLLVAARREGRKMSLAALTRAAQKEEDEYLQNDLLSPTRESPPTGTWFPAETPREEGLKVFGETPSMRRGSDAEALSTPSGVPTIGSGRTRRGSKLDDNDLERNLTIAEEQEALASTRGSSDENHQYGSGSGSDEQDHITSEEKKEYRRSHEMIPEEEEPEDDEEEEIGNETILENLVASREDDTLRMTLPSHSSAIHEESSENMFEYNDEIERSPNPGTDAPLIDSAGSASGTGNTASSLRVPSRSGSALDTMMIRSVDSEREAYISQSRSMHRVGSYAASAMSDMESEVGQVTEAIKRNLSIKTPSKKYTMGRRDSGDEEEDENTLSPTRGLSIPRPGSRRPSASRRKSSSGSVPSPLKENVVPSSIERVFANRPSFSFNAPAGNRERDKEINHSPRGNTYTLSPGPRFPSIVGAEPMMRQSSAQSSHLRNVVRVRPPSEEVPPLAPSVASDSASSEGHGLESPPITEGPYQPLPIPDMAKSLPSDPIPSKTLDPNWRPGSHNLHTQIAHARTSFSSPSQPPPVASPSRTRERKGSMAAEQSEYNHQDYLVAPKSRPSSPSGTSGSSHEPMLSGMQTRLKQLEARDEALRKFSVASAVSGGGYERERVGSAPIPRGSTGGYERERVGSGPLPRGSVVRERVPSLLNQRGDSFGGQGTNTQQQEGEEEKVIRKRRSYTSALGSRPLRPTSDDTHVAPPSNLGGTTLITRRSYGATPPESQSPTRLEVSYFPPPSLALQRNLSTASASTTATTIEAALAARRPGPIGPRSSPTSRFNHQIPPIPMPVLEVDPYSHTPHNPGYSYAPPNNEYGQSPRGGDGGGFQSYLAPGQAYGAEAYGSEAGSVASRNSARNRWAEPYTPWMRNDAGSQASSEGLL